MPHPERGLLIGRFQPVHRGHLEVIRRLRAKVPTGQLLLAVGSAQRSYSSDNPFTAGERIEMLLRACREAGLEGCWPIPVVDIDRHAEWVAYLEGLLPTFGRVYSNNPLTRLLFERAGYAVEELPWVEREQFEGRRVRQELASGDAWKGKVPPAVAEYLIELSAPERLRMLAGTPPPPGARSGA